MRCSNDRGGRGRDRELRLIIYAYHVSHPTKFAAFCGHNDINLSMSRKRRVRDSADCWTKFAAVMDRATALITTIQ